MSLPAEGSYRGAPAAAPRPILAAQEVRPGRERGQSGMRVLVSALAIFQLCVLWAPFIRGRQPLLLERVVWMQIANRFFGRFFFSPGVYAAFLPSSPLK